LKHKQQYKKPKNNKHQQLLIAVETVVICIRCPNTIVHTKYTVKF